MKCFFSFCERLQKRLLFPLLLVGATIINSSVCDAFQAATAATGANDAAVEAALEALKDGFFREGPVERGEYQISTPGRGETLDGPWSVEIGNVDLRTYREQIPYKGAHAVDLNGSRAGSLYQRVTLVPGTEYKLGFLAAGNWATNPTKPRHFSVWIGTERVQFTIEPPAEIESELPEWQTMSASFTAARAVNAVRFQSDNPGFKDGTLITAVSFSLDGPAFEEPPALDTLEIPLPDTLDDFVADRQAAIVLGKALFWDMQAGSDGRTACASCHWNAGADIRTRHSVEAGAIGSVFPRDAAQQAARDLAAANKRGNNVQLSSSDFPLHKVAKPTKPANEAGFEEYANPVERSTSEVIGSQGVVAGAQAGVFLGSAVEPHSKVVDSDFTWEGGHVRRVTGRNAPTNINAVFLDRLFWDGRAQHEFNGVNPFGDLDSDARVWKASSVGGSMEQVQVLLNNAALASQSVGPILSSIEMSWTGREFSEIGRKLFSLRPLALQRVAADDSVLGPYVSAEQETGLDEATAGYAQLVRAAFKPEWWSSVDVTESGHTQMEANFSLFWGLSLMMYQSTLVSDQTPYDAYANGDEYALSDAAKVGLSIFMNEGNCYGCHGGPQFAGGTVNSLPGAAGESGVEHMEMAAGGEAWYDAGFYNIGVRPSVEDLGVGADIPGFGPLSYVRREQNGRGKYPESKIGPNERTAVNGAFKSPSLRNVELTGPYMHNGGFSTLEQVVEFYTRGADFFHTNIDDLDPAVDGIPSLQSDPEGIAALVEFMKSLTDERVRNQAAPFDHPELILVHGHDSVVDGTATDKLCVLPATGANGGDRLQTFEEALENFQLPDLDSVAVAQLPLESQIVVVSEEPAAEEPAAEEPAAEEPAAEEDFIVTAPGAPDDPKYGRPNYGPREYVVLPAPPYYGPRYDRYLGGKGDPNYEPPVVYVDPHLASDPSNRVPYGTKTSAALGYKMSDSDFVPTSGDGGVANSDAVAAVGEKIDASSDLTPTSYRGKYYVPGQALPYTPYYGKDSSYRYEGELIPKYDFYLGEKGDPDYEPPVVYIDAHRASDPSNLVPYGTKTSRALAYKTADDQDYSPISGHGSDD
jgi:cytochrome c peroxidase